MNTITLDIPQNWAWTDDELYAFCLANRDKVIERNAKGQILIMPSTGGITSSKNSDLITELVIWNRKKRTGIVFDSNGGFLLPNKAMRAPDAAWLSNQRWNNLTDEEKEKFPPLCPDFVVELRSPSDQLDTIKDKMTEWIENGSRLGWLIDPIEQKAWIYRQNGSIELVEGFTNHLTGEEVLPEFVLDLSILK